MSILKRLILVVLGLVVAVSASAQDRGFPDFPETPLPNDTLQIVVYDGTQADPLDRERRQTVGVMLSAVRAELALAYGPGDLIAGTGITLVPSGGSLTINSSGGGSVDFGNVDTDILPNADNAHSVGSAARTWSSGRFTGLTVDGALTVGGDSLDENVDDQVDALIVDGTNITTVYDDTAGTLTVNAAGGSGGTAVAYQSNIRDLSGYSPSTWTGGYFQIIAADVNVNVGAFTVTDATTHGSDRGPLGRRVLCRPYGRVSRSMAARGR